MTWITKILPRSKLGPESPGASKNGAAPPSLSKSGVTVDKPIQRQEEDSLGRDGSARSFAQGVLALDATDGLVVGVLGAWGSGKTSFVNLARNEFERAGVAILDFNPWMFSGAEQLVGAFFTELAAQLRVRPEFTEIANNIDEYGEALSGITWLPVVGPWIDRGRRVSKLLARMLERRKQGLGGRRAILERALASLDHRILVVLDDIDRLSSSEVRDIFKLVRLTASFPNVVYLMAFDRSRVEQALSEQGVPGRDYLEKILQVAVDLPALPPEVMLREIPTAIESALSEIETPGPLDGQLWPDIFMEIVRPLVKNMRDVRRYAAAIRGTVMGLNGQIALADVLGLEAIRTFLPDVHAQFHNAVGALTTTSPMYGGRSDAENLKPSIDSLIAVGGRSGEVVRAMITRLFPAARRHIENYHFGPESKSGWRRGRRVAHEDILRLYLERVAGQGLQAFTDAERAFDHMADQAAFESYLLSLDAQRLRDVIASLETFEESFSAEHVVPGTTVLLNLLPDLPRGTRGMFDLGPGLVVSRVVLRLLRSLADPSKVEAAVAAVLPQLKTLTTRQQLIEMVGYQEGVGQKLVSEAAAAEFAKSWRSDVRSALPLDLVLEPELLSVLSSAKRTAAADEPPLTIPEGPAITLAVLLSARTETVGQAVGSRAVRRFPRLHWSTLVELFDGEDKLRERVDRLREAKLQVEDDLMNLVNRYLEGWRPSHLDED